MDAELTDALDIPDNELNEALEAHALDELDGLSIQNQRLARIQEYEEASLARPDAFAAVLGMGNAHLQRVVEHLGAAILEELDSRAHTVEEIREFEPEIRLLVKLRNSIEKDLAVRPPDVGEQAAAFRHGKKSGRFDSKVAAGKHNQLPNRWRANR